MSDEKRLREAGLQELGAAGAVAGVNAAELVDSDASPTEKLNDSWWQPPTEDGIRSLEHPGGPAAGVTSATPRCRTGNVAGITPATVRVAVQIKAAVYRSDGHSFTGSDRRRRKLSLVWTLKLGGAPDDAARWRLDDSLDQ